MYPILAEEEVIIFGWVTHILLSFINTVLAGSFRGVLIFVIFVVDSAVTKISTNEN